MKRLTALGMVAWLASVGTAPLTAQTTVRSTFGPGDVFSGSAYEIIGPATPYHQWLAVPFTPTGAGYLSLVRIAASRDTQVDLGNLATLHLGIGGATPAAASWLATWSVTLPTTASILSFAPSSSILLSTSSVYWLMMTTAAATEAWWYRTPTTAYGDLAWGWNSGANWAVVNNSAYTYPAFDVSVAGANPPVPEPHSMVLLGTGLLVLGAVGRRKRR